MSAKVIIVAGTIPRATDLARELRFISADILTCSPASMRYGAGRGVIADLALIDETAWPLDELLLQVLRYSLLRNGGQVYRLERVTE